MSERDRRPGTIAPFLVAADLVALVAGGLAVLQHVTLPAVLGAALGAVLVGRGLHLHQPRLVLSVLEDLPAICLVALSGVLLLLGLSLPTLTARDASWSVVVLAGGVMLGGMLVARGVGYAAVRGLRRRGVLAHRLVVVGSGETGRHLASALLARPSLGLVPIGFVDDAVDPRDLPAPLLGPLDRLPLVLRDLGVGDVIFAFGAAPDARTLALVRWCQAHDRQVFVVPRFFEVMGLDRGRRVEAIADVSVLRLHRQRRSRSLLAAKRLLDASVAAAALVVLSPVLGLAAWLLHRETRSGVLFRQERVGRDGRRFELLKLRTIPATAAEAATRWNADTDPRLGPVGRFLRRTGIDELPQLWNIVRGDMSLVGPRPERPIFVEQFSRSTPGYRHRHRMAAGLTGWAQVQNLRGDTSIPDRARADNYYIENWSLWADVKIVVRTFGTFRRPAPRSHAHVMELVSAGSRSPQVGPAHGSARGTLARPDLR